jgi:magnesium-transporting ATPase (P-type)
VPAQQLVAGDLVQLQWHDNVPADRRLIQAFGVRVNHASVIGESAPVARDADASSC